MIPKFRAWYTPFKGEKFGQEMKYGQAGSLITHAEMSPDKYVLMQSTGLKDKNDVEIFEGDIVLENGMKKIVTFGEQEYEEDYGDLMYYIGFNVCTKFGYSTLVHVEHEVIGNIYEHPELLERSGTNDHS